MIALALSAALLAPAGPPLKEVKIRQVMPKIYHLEFPSRRLLAATFLRFQEHYESAQFHGKVFTAKEFLAWYGKSPKGTKSDYFDWDGFNVPSRALARFYAGDFNPLDANEKAFLALFADIKGDFNVIGTAGKDGGDDTLRHEIAHGLYDTSPLYRAQARSLLKEADLQPVFRMLERLGYDSSVWEDEAHAWLGDSLEDLKAEGLDPAPYAALRARLLTLYERFSSGGSGL